MRKKHHIKSDPFTFVVVSHYEEKCLFMLSAHGTGNQQKPFRVTKDGKRREMFSYSALTTTIMQCPWFESRDSSVCIATGYRLGGRSSNPIEGKFIYAP
jgi:hypothetical protein